MNNYFNTPEDVKTQDNHTNQRQAAGMDMAINNANSRLVNSLNTPDFTQKESNYTKQRETNNFIWKPTTFNPTMDIL